MNVARLLLAVAHTFALVGAEAIRLPDARVGEPFEYGLVVQGMVEPLSVTWSGELPGGVEADGLWIRGTPRSRRDEPYRLTATIDGALTQRDDSVSQVVELFVRPAIEPLRLTDRALPAFAVGERVQYGFGARGGEGPYEWSASGHGLGPLGLELVNNPEGELVLQGRPARAGEARVEVGVRDAIRTTPTKTFTVRVLPRRGQPLEVATEALPAAYLWLPYECALVARGGVPPYRWSIGWPVPGRPAWLTAGGEPGRLTGIVDRLGSWAARVQVIDSTGARSPPKELTLDVRSHEWLGDLDIYPESLGSWVVGEPARVASWAVGAPGPVRWRHDWVAEAPGGLEVSSSDRRLALSGVPERAGRWHIAMGFDVVDGSGRVLTSFDAEREVVVQEPPAPAREPQEAGRPRTGLLVYVLLTVIFILGGLLASSIRRLAAVQRALSSARERRGGAEQDRDVD